MIIEILITIILVLGCIYFFLRLTKVQVENKKLKTEKDQLENKLFISYQNNYVLKKKLNIINKEQIDCVTDK